jgi:hypothetical protein
VPTVEEILALAQKKAQEAVDNAGSTHVGSKSDPEKEAAREAKEKAKAERNATIIDLFEGVDMEDKEVEVSKQTVVNVLIEAGKYVPRKRHTTEDFDKVAKYFREGMTNLTEVAEASGYDYQYVRAVAVKLGVDYDNNRGRMDPEKMPEIVERALALEEFAGVSILTIGQFVHKLKKEAQGDTPELNADGTPRKKRGRKPKNQEAETVEV